MSGRPVTVFKHTAPDCAFCRNSETRALEGARFGFVCGKGRTVLDAPSCSDFKDSRQPSRNAFNQEPR